MIEVWTAEIDELSITLMSSQVRYLALNIQDWSIIRRFLSFSFLSNSERSLYWSSTARCFHNGKYEMRCEVTNSRDRSTYKNFWIASGVWSCLAPRLKLQSTGQNIARFERSLVIPMSNKRAENNWPRSLWMIWRYHLWIVSGIPRTTALYNDRKDKGPLEPDQLHL